MTHFEVLFIYGMKRTPTSSLCGYLSVPAPFNSLALTLVKNQLTIYKDLFWTLNSTSFHILVYMSLLMLVPYCLDYYKRAVIKTIVVNDMFTDLKIKVSDV